MSANRNNMLYFFERPTEPCFMQKGESKTVFQIPDNFYPEKYQNSKEVINKRFGTSEANLIPVWNIALPDLSLPKQLSYHDQFSLWVPKHRQMAGKLIDIFIGMKDLDDLQSICAYCQLHINPYLFNYSLSVAMLHRPDTKGLDIPSLAEVFPDKFMDPKVFRRAREVPNVVPNGSRPEKYQNSKEVIGNRFGTSEANLIPIRNITLPDLSLPKELFYHDQFSLWVPKHRKMAGKLIDIFMGMKDLDDLQSICAYCQLHINPYLFNYSLSVAMLHRPDTKGLDIPSLVEVFPDKFMDPKVFRRAREVSNVVPDGFRMPIEIPVNYTASDAEPEQRIAYFREDIGVNLHHWHWHLVYPFDASDRSIVDKDRRGELFYYMHQQIVARYNVERFCNGLQKVKPFDDFRAPIVEGYFPKLDSHVASRTWPPRFANSTIKDVNRPVDQIRVNVSDMETWRDRLVTAIESNSVMLPNGRCVQLEENTGIDILGNLIESSIISLNRPYYGDLHTMGHVFISYAHDPDHRYLEPFGVMGDSTTAMRDPIFYRWHCYIDDLFVLWKKKLPPYGSSSVSVEGAGGVNRFRTQWEQSTLELGRGLDFTPRGSVLAIFTHLQHDEYNYVLEVNNTSSQSVMGTVRLFLAPVNGDDGQTLDFEEQRRIMIELDKFTQPLSPGMNTFRRRSVDSSVTIPYERTFRDQSRRPGDPGSAAAAEFDFCGCGWPHHMLIPKGTSKGYPVVLFAMISDWTQDRIEQDLVGTCNDASSYCGIRDRRYPDKRAMGYPFDRVGGPTVNSLEDFLTPNMAIRQCEIRFYDQTRIRGQS